LDKRSVNLVFIDPPYAKSLPPVRRDRQIGNDAYVLSYSPNLAYLIDYPTLELIEQKATHREMRTAFNQVCRAATRCGNS
jgi:16S rRNA G966 N2-methylase RsmD